MSLGSFPIEAGDVRTSDSDDFDDDDDVDDDDDDDDNGDDDDDDNHHNQVSFLSSCPPPKLVDAALVFLPEEDGEVSPIIGIFKLPEMIWDKRPKVFTIF